MELKQLDKQYIANTYARFPVELTHGKGSQVWDEQGKAYIDMGSGIGVTAFGIADDAWQKAVTEQLGKLQHMSNLYYTEPCALLAQQLCERTGMKKVFFCNSGAEANEGMIKTARKYAAEHKGSEYSTIVTLVNSFHGRTITTLAATGQAHYHELFQPLTPGFVHAPANDLEAVKKAALDNKAGAVMIECIQGEGGVIPLKKEFVTGLAAFCAEEGLLLLVDEVQTGNGRTGALYAYMNYGVQPDIISTAKGIGGGLPLGAVLFGEKTEYTLGAGDHGSTFGGNPVCCAGALSILSRIDDSLLAEVREKSEMIFRKLQGAPGIEDVAGMGLMIGVKTVKPAADVLKACMEKGVLCLTAKDRVRLLPALNIPMALLEQALDVILEAAKP
ncbi:MAG: acetylornithine/succinylornithine family transaminase [Oscillospiraceae bacterium]|nr:acetylornithine/succinylornithine family transaminase [Oscillospiraceae bacterium]